MGQFTDAGSIETDWHRLCAKDIQLVGSWGLTANDMALLGICMLDRARDRYPWHRMQTTFSFTEESVFEATRSAMAMGCLKATIIPNEGMELQDAVLRMKN